MNYQNIIVERHGKVGLIQMNLPAQLNALSSSLVKEVSAAFTEFSEDSNINAIVFTGVEKAFAAGADISEIKDKQFVDLYNNDFVETDWESVARCKKPVIAAVSGFALGGGCEIAMMCDFIIAADNAKFGQPEIKLGVIPGAGGTQRLVKCIGKAKAMDMCLTGRMMDAQEAERSGLVSRIVPANELLETALKVASKIASYSQPVAMLAKDVINYSFDSSLSEGIRYERKVFQALFSTDDQKEGMAAFMEKRKPEFKNR